MTVEELATEMGIDLATAKPEGVAKFRTFVADTNRQHAEASTLAAQAESNLRKVKEEQDAITKHIERYGGYEDTHAALRANNAAMEAQLKTLKESGLNVNLPGELPKRTVTEPGKATFDPDKFRGAVSTTIADLTDLNNKHLFLYGKPLPDRSNALADEARAAGKSLYEYGAQKYDFAGAETKKSQESQAAHDAEVAAKAVKEFREKNPNMG